MPRTREKGQCKEVTDRKGHMRRRVSKELELSELFRGTTSPINHTTVSAVT